MARDGNPQISETAETLASQTVRREAGHDQKNPGALGLATFETWGFSRPGQYLQSPNDASLSATLHEYLCS